MDIFNYLVELRIPKEDAEIYKESLINEGFDDLQSLKEDATFEDLKAISMKPGHIKRLMRELSTFVNVSVMDWTVQDCLIWLKSLTTSDSTYFDHCSDVFNQLQIDGKKLMLFKDEFSLVRALGLEFESSSRDLFGHLETLRKESSGISNGFVKSSSFYFPKVNGIQESTQICRKTTFDKGGLSVAIPAAGETAAAAGSSSKSIIDSFKSGHTFGIMLPSPRKVPITQPYDMQLFGSPPRQGDDGHLFVQDNLTISPFGFDFQQPDMGKTLAASSIQHRSLLRVNATESGPVQCTRESIIRIRKIGSGGSGTVFKAIYEPTFEILAVKLIEVGETTGRKEILSELKALYSISKYNLATRGAGAEDIPAGRTCPVIAESSPLSSEADTPLLHAVAMRRCASGYISDSGDEGVAAMPASFKLKKAMPQVPAPVVREITGGVASSTASGSPYIVKFYDAYLDPQSGAAYLVLEYLRGGSLQDMLDKGATFQDHELLVVAYSVLQALSVLHARNIVHRDIKPANILMDGEGHVKLSDFGIMRDLSESLSSETFTGTLPFMSPERIRADKYTSKSDIWSLGITLLTLHKGFLPFPSERGYWVLREAIQNFALPAEGDGATSGAAGRGGGNEDLRDFVQQCLCVDPEERPAAQALLQHPFILKAVRKGVLPLNGVPPPCLTGSCLTQIAQMAMSTAELDDLMDHLIQWQLSHLSAGSQDLCYIASIAPSKLERLARQLQVDVAVLASKHEFKRCVFNDAIELSRELNRRNSSSSSSRSTCRSAPVITAPVMAALLTVNRTLAPASSIHDLRALMQQTSGSTHPEEGEKERYARGDAPVEDWANTNDNDNDEEDDVFYTPHTPDSNEHSCSEGSGEHRSTSSSTRGANSSHVSSRIPFGKTRAGPQGQSRTQTFTTNDQSNMHVDCCALGTRVQLDEFDLPRVESPSSYDSSDDDDERGQTSKRTDRGLLLQEEIDTAFSLCLNLNPNSSCCHSSPLLGRQQTSYDFEMDVLTPTSGAGREEELKEHVFGSAVIDCTISTHMSAALAEETRTRHGGAKQVSEDRESHPQFKSTRSLLPHACPLVMVSRSATDCCEAEGQGSEQREASTVGEVHPHHSPTAPHTLHRVTSYYKIDEQRLCLSLGEQDSLATAPPHSTTTETVMNFRESPQSGSSSSDLSATGTRPHHSNATTFMEIAKCDEHANFSSLSVSMHMAGGQTVDFTRKSIATFPSGLLGSSVFVAGPPLPQAEWRDEDSCATSVASGDCGQKKGQSHGHLGQSLGVHVAKTPSSQLLVQTVPHTSLQLTTRWGDGSEFNALPVRGEDSTPNSEGSVDVDQSATSSVNGSHPSYHQHQRDGRISHSSSSSHVTLVHKSSSQVTCERVDGATTSGLTEELLVANLAAGSGDWSSAIFI